MLFGIQLSAVSLCSEYRSCPVTRAFLAASTLQTVDKALKRAMSLEAELEAVTQPGFFRDELWNVSADAAFWTVISGSLI